MFLDLSSTLVLRACSFTSAIGSVSEIMHPKSRAQWFKFAQTCK